MTVRALSAPQKIDAGRDAVAVVIPVFGAVDLLADCLRSVLEHTAVEQPIVVADDGTPGTAVAEAIAALAPRQDVFHLRRERNVGFVANVQGALDAVAPADAAIVNSDCVVAAGWLEGLRAAATSDSRIATASALANNGSILTVELPQELALDDAAARVRAGALGLRPHIPTAIGHCFYVRRTALELVGGLDEAFSPGYGEEVDFSQRCLRHGLQHVVADDVYVIHRGEGTFGTQASELRAAHERLIEERYPYYPKLVRSVVDAERGPLVDALAAARRSLHGMSVTIDASALGPVEMGTQVTIRALISALSAIGVRLRVVVPRSASIEGAETVYVDEVEQGVGRTDVVHRPSQLTEPKHLDWLHRLGERIVITQQDLIADSSPAYFDSYESFDEHRTLTRQALSIADATVFISEHVRDEAIAAELVTPDRAVVIPQGVDHDMAPATRPPGAPAGDYVLCLGTDFEHKNRAFAVRVHQEMGRRGFAGRLVVAGPQVAGGPVDNVLALGQVSEGEKTWLYENAALVIYPTLAEGFGLVPFEAARVGVPCMFAAQSSLPEVVGAENATIVAWDAVATAEKAMALLADEAARRRLVDAISERGRRYTWERTARSLLDLYAEVVRRPQRPARAIYFGEALSDVALSLVGPGGYLPPDVQRALLAAGARPALRRPLFGALRTSYRLLRRR